MKVPDEQGQGSLGREQERHKLVLAPCLSCGREQPCPRLVGGRPAGVWRCHSHPSEQAPSSPAAADPVEIPDAKLTRFQITHVLAFHRKMITLSKTKGPERSIAAASWRSSLLTLGCVQPPGTFWSLCINKLFYCFPLLDYVSDRCSWSKAWTTVLKAYKDLTVYPSYQETA